MDHPVLAPLPPKVELETRPVLKRLVPAHRYLAELKGMAATTPNEHILINTLALQEAKDSSEIENIITTQDEMFKADLFADYRQMRDDKRLSYKDGKPTKQRGLIAVAVSVAYAVAVFRWV